MFRTNSHQIMCVLGGTIWLLFQSVSVQAQPVYVNDGLQVASATVLAETCTNVGKAPVIRVRFHVTPDATVQMIYGESSASIVEGDLAKAIDYSRLNRKSPTEISHYLFKGTHQEKYVIGHGVNQLDIWDETFYGHYKYLEHSGIGLEHALVGSWRSQGYTVAIDRTPIRDTSTPSLVLTASRGNDGKNVFCQIQAFGAMTDNGPFQRIEYTLEGALLKVVRNSDFQKVKGGLVFPRTIEVDWHDGSNRHERHTITLVNINPVLDPALFESPVPHPGARVFQHQTVGESHKVIEFAYPETNVSALASDLLGDGANSSGQKKSDGKVENFAVLSQTAEKPIEVVSELNGTWRGYYWLFLIAVATIAFVLLFRYGMVSRLVGRKGEKFG